MSETEKFRLAMILVISGCAIFLATVLWVWSAWTAQHWTMFASSVGLCIGIEVFHKAGESLNQAGGCRRCSRDDEDFMGDE